MAQTQAKRMIEATSPLGADVLLFRHMEAEEELGRLFKFTVDLLSEDEQIKFEDLLGQPMTIRLDLPEGKKRYFHGFVSSFAYTGRYRNFASYKAVLRPWLWFLTRTADCRIFQNKTVPDIIKEIFREHGFTDVDDLLSGTYRTWEYCVQYRETDFNFVSRLMEQEGMYYFFTHEQEEHTIVLADSISAHQRIRGYECVPYYPPSDNVVREEDHFYDWYLSQEVQPGSYVLDDFDFKRPQTDLMVKLAKPCQHARSDFEVFDYTGEYVETAEGNCYVRARFEELQSQHERVKGQGNARGLYAGGLFELSKYPRQDQNREYLIVSATHHLHSPAYETGAVAEALPLYTCEFEAIGSHQAYRSPRTTVKPHVQGPQTAIVVGPSGEEIHTDQYGRVKVQFHWDRYGKLDENSSCWVRVSHAWAGQNWGMMAIPRMGQEVIVDFLEGDPDQPIITGRVYNGSQMPPYALPANATQTGILSRSSKGGSGANANEFRFEDKKGAEQVYLHAEKNQDISVENDETHSVGHDRKKTIDNDETVHVKHNRTETVDGEESITVNKNRTRKVMLNETVSVMLTRTRFTGVNDLVTVIAAQEIGVGGYRLVAVGLYQDVKIGAYLKEKIGVNRDEEVGANRTSTVKANDTLTVKGGQTISVTKDQSVTVSGGQTVSVTKDQSVTISAGQTVSVTKDQGFKVDGGRSAKIGKDDALNVGKNLVIDAGDSITIKTGDASITMKKDGTIQIKGKDINIKGSGKVSAKADGDMVLKASKIGEN